MQVDLSQIKILADLILEQFKMDLLIQYNNPDSSSDVFYEEIKLNDCAILPQVYKLIGFPFYGEDISENFKPIYELLTEYYFDNILYEEHANKNVLKDACLRYVKWLIEEKNKLNNT